MVITIPTYPQILQWLAELPPEGVAAVLLVLALPLAVANFVLKSFVIGLLRMFGLSHPAHYQYWPSLPWRVFYAAWVQFSLWREQLFHFGKRETGNFAGALSMFLLRHQSNRLFVGRATVAGFGTVAPVGLKVSRHLFCYAMTGGGKTTWLIAMIQNWNGSVFIIDPKGQVTDALARCDKREWIVLDPYNPRDQINVFDVLKSAIERGEDPVKWAMRIAESLIVTPAGSKTPFFTDTSRGFVTSLILHILSFFDETHHNLGFMRELILHGLRVTDEHGNIETSSEEARALLYKTMRDNAAFHGAVAGGAAAFEEASGETEGNLLSTLLEQTKWLDIPSVQYLLSATTKPLEELKTRDDVVVAFVSPVLSIREELKPLARLLTNMVSYTFESVKHKKGQCLTVVDELQAMGYNATIEVVLPVARSYGQTFVGIAQDMEGMKAAYPSTYQSFTGNADAVLWLGSNHQSNLKHLSQVLGRRSVTKRDRRTGQKSRYNQAVMNEEQLGRLLDPERGNMIVTRAGKRPLLLKQDPYFKALPVWSYDPDPDHKEPILRAMMRFLLNHKPKQK